MPLDSSQLKCILASDKSQSKFSLLDCILGGRSISDNEKSIITAINSLLADNMTHCIALEFLSVLMSYCSQNVLIENALYWSSHCIVLHPDDSSKEIKLHALTQILENSVDTESFNKRFTSEYLSIILKACLSNRCIEENNVSLKCLSQCMKKFPLWFGNHKQKIEPFLLECLETSNENVALSAAACFVYFLETGSAGVNGVYHINNFSSYFRKICATIRRLYDNFFFDFGEFDNSVHIDEEVIEFNHNWDSNKTLETVAYRIVNCLIFMEAMIKMKFSVEKRIVPKHVFDIISRGLSAHVCISEALTLLGDIDRCMLLKKIQLKLFKLLRLFTRVYQANLAPFAFVLRKSILNTWKRTSKCGCYDIDILFKATAYKTLISCLSLSKNLNNRHFLEDLMSVVVNDICPIRNAILLEQKLNQTHSIKNNTNELKLKGTRNFILEHNCIYALEALKCVLNKFPVFINQQLLQEMVSVVVKIMSDLQLNKISAPYDSTMCQIKLYEVLISTFKIEDLKILPSIHLMTTILSRGLKSFNWKISQTSAEGLELLEKISQPVCASLFIQDPCSHFQKQQQNYNNILNIPEAIAENGKSGDHCEILPMYRPNLRKKINVISDILINKERVVGGKNTIKEYNKEIFMQENDKEEIIIQENNEELCIQESITENVTENMNDEIKGHFPGIVDSEITIQQTSCDLSRAGMSTSSNIENMFCTFQDIIQD